jgi:uncharacterized membrane protein
MRKIFISAMAIVLAVSAVRASSSTNTVTNVVTNVVHETRVKWDTYPVTNGYYEVYGGTLTTNRVYDTPRWVWKNGGLALITNYVDTVTAGTTTTTVYNIEWRMRPD